MGAVDSTFNNSFISGDDFAVSALFQVDDDSEASDIFVNFYEENIEDEFQGGTKIVKTFTAQAKTDDVTGVKKNSTLIINNTTYYVIKAISDAGITELSLSAVQL